MPSATPYNTRRKSLSLPSLGIHLPQSSRVFANARHLSPTSASPIEPSPKTPTALSSSFTPKSSSSPARPDSSATPEQSPPKKRTKRQHPDASPVISPSITGFKKLISPQTPPISPPPASSRISHEGVNDEIVSASLEALEACGNRPLTVKELATVLQDKVYMVEHSANPHAIISSRLNGYLKRSFPASKPCQLAKKLIVTHPRRIYFYLTTFPHQPIPEFEFEAQIPARASRAAPSPTPSNSRSPSPEIDDLSHEFGDDSLPTPSKTNSSISAESDRDSSMMLDLSTVQSQAKGRQAMSSPPLDEHTEEGYDAFERVASQMKQRSESRDLLASGQASPRDVEMTVPQIKKEPLDDDARPSSSQDDKASVASEASSSTSTSRDMDLLGLGFDSVGNPPRSPMSSQHSTSNSSSRVPAFLASSPVIGSRQLDLRGTTPSSPNLMPISPLRPMSSNGAKRSFEEHLLGDTKPLVAKSASLGSDNTPTLSSAKLAINTSGDSNTYGAWIAELQSPENIGMDELDNMLDDLF